MHCMYDKATIAVFRKVVRITWTCLFIAVCIFICFSFGLPWCVTATNYAIAYIMSTYFIQATIAVLRKEAGIT